MKRFSFIFLFFALPLFVSSQTVNKCLDCHETIGDKVVELFKHDIHSEKGITCAGCHGGDDRAEEMEQSMSKERGFIGVPKGDDISKTCASCHSSAPKMVKEFNSILPRNQLETLAGSVHGKLSTSGKEHIAQCTTCHSAHGIVSPKHTRSPVHPVNVPNTCAKCHANASFMKAYNSSLPVDQLDKYRTSLHGMKNAQGDSKVAACANCHGSHDIRSAKDAKSKVYASSIPATCGTCHSNARYMKGYGIPTDQLKKFTGSVHGKALLEKHDLSAPACNDCHGNHGAAPPDVESISKVCGTCHALNANLFASSPHKKAFDNRRLPECETCHGNHEIVAATDELLGVSKEAVCSRCHQENRSVKGYAIAKTMRGLIDSLESSEHVADSLVTDAEQKGMEVTEERFKLREVRQARLQSRTAVHSFDETKFREVVEKGIAVSTAVATEGNNAIDEYYFRRKGLGVASLIITIVAVSLYLTIRRIEKRQQNKK